MRYDLHQGDCLEVMPTLPADSIDTIITDPPYGLEFMGKDWDKFGATSETAKEGTDKTHPFRGGTNRIRYGYGPKASYSFQLFMTDVFTEALRVAKPGAMLLAFGGTRTHHRLMVAIEDAGWQIRDVIMWVYGSGFPKSHNIGKALNGNGANWHGYGTALKPAWEPIVVAMKPLAGTFAQNALEHGVAGLWVDGARVETGERAAILRRNDKSLDGDVYGSGINGSKANGTTTQGRWPANLIHDGSDEVVGLFPVTTSGRPGQNGHKRNGTLHDTSGGWGMRHSLNAGELYGDTGSAARFFYCAKASRAERNAGLEGLPERQKYAKNGQGGSHEIFTSEAATDSAWAKKNPNKPAANHHPTVKPLALMRYLARITRTPTGGKVLDMFAGSGSTGVAALLEARAFVGIELDADYIEIARRRLEHAASEPVQPPLFSANGGTP